MSGGEDVPDGEETETDPSEPELDPLMDEILLGRVGDHVGPSWRPLWEIY